MKGKGEITIDPLISGGLGGVGSQIVVSAWNSLAQPWIDDYFRNHLPAAREKADANARKMFEDLAQRLAKMEQMLAAKGQDLSTLRSQLDDPDFSADLKTAALAAARTSRTDYHQLLSRAIAERLVSNRESLCSLTTSLVLEAIPRLAARHLDCLAWASILYNIRPTDWKFGKISFDLADYASWLDDNMQYFSVPQLGPLDYVHLMSVSCLKTDSFFRRDLAKVLEPPPSLAPGLENLGKIALDQLLGRRRDAEQLQALWADGLQSITLTSTGQLLGIYVFNMRSGKQTILGDEWGNRY